MQSPTEMLVLIAPLLVVQLGLIALALYDLARRKRVRFDNKLIWGAVILLIGIVGPAAYFLAGREEA